eukprot:398231-Pyramimonas_sp.AAC.1
MDQTPGDVEWATKIRLPRDETLLRTGLEPLYHHVVRCLPSRVTQWQTPVDAPIEALQIAAQTALATNNSGSAW